MEKEENSLDYEYGADEFVPIDSEVKGKNIFFDSILSKYRSCSIPSEDGATKLKEHFKTALKIGITAEEMDRAIKEDDAQLKRELKEWSDIREKAEGIRWDWND